MTESTKGYSVTRQIQWPDGKAIVEVSRGSIDYCNPDALSAKYQGEFATFDSAIEACESAISICRLWRKDGRKDAKVGSGFTLGMTMPFDPETFKGLREWARKRESIDQEAKDEFEESDLGIAE